MTLGTHWKQKAVLLAVALFLYAPLLVLVLNSFNASKYGGRWVGFTTQWYSALMKDGSTMSALKNTLLVAVLASLGATVLGTMAAWMIHRYKTRLQKLHLMLMELPLVVPDIWIGVAMQAFFIQAAWSLSLGTVMVAHTTFCLCYVTALMLGRMQSFDFSIVEAARDLGASSWQVTWRVVLPWRFFWLCFCQWMILSSPSSSLALAQLLCLLGFSAWPRPAVLFL
jgi:spermidine/putrescine transport system permease protein